MSDTEYQFKIKMTDEKMYLFFPDPEKTAEYLKTKVKRGAAAEVEYLPTHKKITVQSAEYINRSIQQLVESGITGVACGSCGG